MVVSVVGSVVGPVVGCGSSCCCVWKANVSETVSKTVNKSVTENLICWNWKSDCLSCCVSDFCPVAFLLRLGCICHTWVAEICLVMKTESESEIVTFDLQVSWILT